jgi:hypothetical protein
MKKYGVTDRNRVKPGIAEATRAVLRRLPERLLLLDPADPDVAHLVHLAGRNGLQVDLLPAGFCYRAVSLIRDVRTA